MEIFEANLSDPHHGKMVIALLNHYAMDPMGGGRPLPQYVKEHLIDELQARPGTVVILGLVDTVPAGLATCFESFSTFLCRPVLNIHDLVVDRRFRGRGLSTKLLEKVETIARKMGCAKLTLEVLEGNNVARAAYRKFGFDGYELDPKMGKALFWQKKLGGS